MSTFYLLKITLVDSKPCIWRRVAAPSDTSLRELHYVIQTVMAWENDHPHVFYLGKNPLAEPSVPFSSDSEEDDLILEDILPLKNRKKPLTYVYDFGDDWIHEITLEDKNYQKSEDTADFVCIDGEFAPPPDDIGGVYEYADIYVCLKNKTPLPKHYDGW
ncbi:MAG: plasmid pRiA4b ORF-3 family protein, partial [Planctomycetia bacterium]|nr:plasmid pRiA4b ORF-3 family protein [Planctomycetia bacterium]